MWWLLAVLAAAHGDDVDLIPKAVTAAQPAAADAENGASFRRRWFVEDAFNASTEPRDVPVPYPSTLAAQWQNRASLDYSLSWRPTKPVALTLNGRLNVFAQDGMSFVSPDTIRLDLREAYATWQPLRDFYIEAPASTCGKEWRSASTRRISSRRARSSISRRLIRRSSARTVSAR